MMIYDVAIIGAGCAGLHLAVQLSRHLPHLRILIVEPRLTYTDDRTWSFWWKDVPEDQKPPFWQKAIGARWPRWQVSYDQQTVISSCPGWNYTSMRGLDFYDCALAELSKNASISWQRGEPLTTLNWDNDGATLTTESTTYRAAYVFDSRPPSPDEIAALPPPAFDQVFAGLRIRTHQPRWDTTLASLMDFQKTSHPRIEFFYTLPTSPQEALVELTWLTPRAHATIPTSDDVIETLTRQFSLPPSDYTILEHERGLIPMVPSLELAAFSSTAEPRHIPIGTRAGAIRASTGYGFLAMADHSERLAHSWKSEGRPKALRYRPAHWSLLDAVFLSAMQSESAQAPQWFCDLFEKNRPIDMIGFMHSDLSLYRLERVVHSLPKMPFIKALWRDKTSLWQSLHLMRRR
jgi:lycopene beta-cyclase